MKGKITSFAVALFLFSLLPLHGIAIEAAEALPDQTPSTDISKTIGINIVEIQGDLTTAKDIQEVKRNRKKIKELIDILKSRVSTVEKEIKQLSAALEGVENKENNENDPNRSGYSEVIKARQDREVELVDLRLQLMAARDVLEKIDQRIVQQEKSDLFYRGEPLWKTYLKTSYQPAAEPAIDWRKEHKPDRILLLFAVITACIFLLSLTKKGMQYISENTSPKNTVNLLASRFSMRSRFYKTYLAMISGLTIVVYILHPLAQELFLPATIVLFVFYWLILKIFLEMVFIRLKGRLLENEPPFLNKLESINFHFFSIISSISILLNPVDLLFYLPQKTAYLTSFILILVWVVSFYLVFRGFCKKYRPALWSKLKFGVIVSNLALLSLEITGYTTLVDRIVYSIGFTCIAIGISTILYDAVGLLTSFSHQLKNRGLENFGIPQESDSEQLRTSSLIRVGLKTLIIAGIILTVLHTWGITNIENDRLQEILLDGFNLGGFTLSPFRFFMAFLLFALAWPAVTTLKQIVDHAWLDGSELTTGARENFLTIGGYVLYGVTLFVVLAFAGIKLTGLTVIIGALSVGIGFGLQNIVNNFISGLILMFERPIKKGDWIQVGTTEGYVKRISIRSTIVQTFDRSDVIVPNSELISNQVTNMMFDDQRGRLRVSVGVAYGSDIELVEKLLLRAAIEEEQVISDGSVPEPRVLFQEFADSSLNFDMLCHIKDVDMKMRVRSKLNFAVDRLFRENDIVIPFPQRDVYMK